MNILCNLPLESFAPRSELGHRVVTYGPAHRMWVDGVFYPFDVTFDPSNGSIEQLLAALPSNFRPDVLLIYWPDQEPLPEGLDRCPVPVVGAISDYNLMLPFLAGLWPQFDVLLVDRPGVDLFRKLSFQDVRAFCQFTYKKHHRIYPDVERDLDVAFAGNLNPVVQRDRIPWIERLVRLGANGTRVEVKCGITGVDYGRFLNRTRIGFNRSIRGEMNLRAFEVPACGALLLMERENQEIREFLTPDEEVVLYDDHDLEDVVADLLADEPRCRRIARAGHERIRDYGMPRRLDALECELSRPGPGRPEASEYARILGRGIGMIPTWASSEAVWRCLAKAQDLAPDDPRPLNALALALLRKERSGNAQRAAHLLQRAIALSPTYVPSVHNLVCLLQWAEQPHATRQCMALLEDRLGSVESWHDLDGPVIPLGFSERAISVSQGLAEAVREGDYGKHLSAWIPP